MVDKVSIYLSEILMPSLQRFHVSESFSTHIVETVRLQMESFLRHWDDLAFRKALLTVGVEEGTFYEPAAKLDVKCFVVVTLRNSPLETIQSDAYASAGMEKSISSEAVKAITGGAIRFFSSLNFDSLCLQAKKSTSSDFYQEIAVRHPVAWGALKAIGVTSAKTVDYPKVPFEEPFHIGALDSSGGKTQEKEEAVKFKDVVFDGYSPDWDPALVELLEHISASSGNIFIVDSLKSVTRNFEKLMDILEFLLTHGQRFASTNFYIENGHVERRVKLLRAGHTMSEMENNLKQLTGLGHRHTSALKNFFKTE